MNKPNSRADSSQSEADKTAAFEEFEREKSQLLQNAQAEFALREQQYIIELKDLRERVQEQITQISTLGSADESGTEERQIIAELNRKVCDLQSVVLHLNGEVERAKLERKVEADAETQV